MAYTILSRSGNVIWYNCRTLSEHPTTKAYNATIFPTFEKAQAYFNEHRFNESWEIVEVEE